MKKILIATLGLILLGCSKGDFKEGKTFIGDQHVSADTLNLGKQVYTEYCLSCHGVLGDGNGPAAKGSVPPPRNFTQGLYKFGWVKDSGLPTDADFQRIIQGGLHGTAMLQWDVSDEQTYAVTQYIKTFAPQVWENKDNAPGTPIDVMPDPYGLARKEFAIKKGKAVFHLAANCQSCHRGYATKSELDAMAKEFNYTKIDELPSDFYDLKIQESEFYFHDSKDRLAKVLPPDFTWHEVRSANSVEDIYKRVTSGVTGSGMPPWRDVIQDDEIWAVSYYVQSLREMKNTEARKELMKKLGK
ncbi:MAG: c-type cytochrome [Bacteriovoracaceae bacterium]|nr:c-type cytochrome [Bacteriovoracaceae bacterium]